MIFFRSCPKCRGDIQLTQDVYGTFKECIQCGFILELEEEPTAPARREMPEAA